jgi:tryptophan halogenase
MHQGYAQVAQQLPSHGAFLRQTALSPLASGAAPTPVPASAPAPADALPRFSFESDSPFTGTMGSPV